VLDGFGGANRAACRELTPRDAGELRAALLEARDNGLSIALRGNGQSYGDASLNTRAFVLDLSGLRRILSWDKQAGVVEVEPGVTVADLWRHILPDGFWPSVVPGTMVPTLAGCAAMNIHGKNNFRVGPLGDHIREFDLLTPDGSTLLCSREQNSEIFHAAIGGLGGLGAFTRLKLSVTPVESGLMRVEPFRTRDFSETFALFEERTQTADYFVGWIDGTASGRALGRGVLHQATKLHADEDPVGPQRTLRVDYQDLPATLYGVPKSIIWRFLKPFMNNPGIHLGNTAKYLSAYLHRRGWTYLQSHAAFHFLLDYVPNWRRAYGPAGLIQYQPFVPRVHAEAVFRELLRMCQAEGLPPYLAVMKRHRSDAFLLSHAVDGYSLALDFPARERERLWAHCHRMTERVLEAGGRFYFAKDSVLRPDQVVRAFGQERIDAYFALKKRLDPEGVLQSDLTRRVFGR
jgi:decaprenylphospho-beta-D-ribofuranose 2-oxidase